MNDISRTTSRFGIEAISVETTHYYLDLGNLARYNNVDPGKYYFGLGGRQFSVAGPSEDSVTLAVAAADKLLENYGVNRNDIGLVVVGSETPVDMAKPLAVYVHGFLRLSTRCRTFDTTHACYGATAGLRMARDWCATSGKGKKALVIASDIARYDIGSPGEPTQGAAAVAMLVGDDPKVMELHDHADAVYSNEVMDFWRPTYRTTALADGHYSIECYLQALEAAYSFHRKDTGFCYTSYDHLLFHVPFPKMAYKAYSHLHNQEAARSRGASFPNLDESYRTRTLPSLWGNRQVGNAYTAAVYLSLAALLEEGDQDLQNRRLGLFSYGSGSCAEFFSGQTGADASAWRGKIGLKQCLDRREEVDVATYLALRDAGLHHGEDGSYTRLSQRMEEKNKPLASYRIPKKEEDGFAISFMGIAEHKRVYQQGRTDDLAMLRDQETGSQAKKAR